MFIRKFFTKLSIAIAVVVLLASGAVWEIRHVRAMPTAVEFDPAFGIVGITRGETMRLNVVNLLDPVPTGVPPGPCRVVLSFRNANGQPFTDANGQVVRSETTLQAGESAFLELNGNLFGPPSTNGAGRLELRPLIQIFTVRGSFAPPCVPTMEVFDNTTGRTSLFAGFPAQNERGHEDD